jgi:hypothetical protein
MITLRQQMENTIDLARTLFIKDGRLNPMVHAIDEKGNHHLCPLEGLPKDLAALALRMFCAEKNIVQLVYLAEAWVLRAKQNVDYNSLPKSLKDHPDRAEALVFHGETAAEQLAAEVVITRDGNRAELGQTEWWTPNMVAGRFVDLIKPRQGTKH